MTRSHSLSRTDVDWRSLCKFLENKSTEELHAYADEYGVDFTNKSISKLIKEICIQREASLVPTLSSCPNKSLTGADFDSIDTYLLVKDILGNCYTLDDLLYIKTNKIKIPELEDDLTLNEYIQLLESRCSQLENEADSCHSLRKSMRYKPEDTVISQDPLPIFLIKINETLTSSNQSIKDISKLVTASKVNTMTSRQIDEINLLIHQYDQTNNTLLLPLVENTSSEMYLQGMINIFNYIAESNNYFELEKLKTNIARLITN